MLSNAVTTFVKRLRLSTLLSNVKNYPKLQHNKALYRQYGIRRKLWQSLSYESITKHSSDIPWMDKDIAPHANQLCPALCLLLP